MSPCKVSSVVGRLLCHATWWKSFKNYFFGEGKNGVGGVRVENTKCLKVVVILK